MSSQNIKQFYDSEDQAFLRNFESMQESQDILEHLCKDQEPNGKIVVKSQEKMQYIQGNSENYMVGENKRSAHSREKKKIFYRDKMAELMRPGQYVKEQYNYVVYSQLDSRKAPISKEEQLKRNRESAKNSRMRKKEYITILEQKNDQNAKLIEDLRFRLDQVTLERDRLKQDHHQEIKNFLKSKGEAYEDLERIVQDPTSSSDNIKNQIQVMLDRFGASGSERISIMNYYMNEIIEDLISDIHKYFLTNSIFSFGFTPFNPKSIDIEVMRILDIDTVKMTHLIQKYRQRFTKEASVFKTLTQQFYRVFKSIESQSRVIELLFIELVKQIDCKKVAELVLWFEQNRFCREVKRIRKEWIQQLKTGQQVFQHIRKQNKPN